MFNTINNSHPQFGMYRPRQQRATTPITESIMAQIPEGSKPTQIPNGFAELTEHLNMLRGKEYQTEDIQDSWTSLEAEKRDRFEQLQRIAQSTPSMSNAYQSPQATGSTRNPNAFTMPPIVPSVEGVAAGGSVATPSINSSTVSARRKPKAPTIKKGYFTTRKGSLEDLKGVIEREEGRQATQGDLLAYLNDATNTKNKHLNITKRQALNGFKELGWFWNKNKNRSNPSPSLGSQDNSAQLKQAPRGRNSNKRQSA